MFYMNLNFHIFLAICMKYRIFIPSNDRKSQGGGNHNSTSLQHCQSACKQVQFGFKLFLICLPNWIPVSPNSSWLGHHLDPNSSQFAPNLAPNQFQIASNLVPNWGWPQAPASGLRHRPQAPNLPKMNVLSSAWWAADFGAGRRNKWSGPINTK